jgi:hypothetical protein
MAHGWLASLGTNTVCNRGWGPHCEKGAHAELSATPTTRTGAQHVTADVTDVLISDSSWSSCSRPATVHSTMWLSVSLRSCSRSWWSSATATSCRSRRLLTSRSVTVEPPAATQQSARIRKDAHANRRCSKHTHAAKRFSSASEQRTMASINTNKHAAWQRRHAACNTHREPVVVLHSSRCPGEPVQFQLKARSPVQSDQLASHTQAAGRRVTFRSQREN